MSPFSPVYNKPPSVTCDCMMTCIYVALNQMFAPGGVMSTKQSGDLSWTVCVRRPAADCSGDPCKPAAGQCRTSGMCTWSIDRWSAWTRKRGQEGWSRSFSFCTLHQGVRGLKQAESGTWFCEFHTKEQIEDTGQGGEDWDSGIFSWNLILKYDYIWIKINFHVSFLLFYLLSASQVIYNVGRKTQQKVHHSPRSKVLFIFNHIHILFLHTQFL